MCDDLKVTSSAIFSGPDAVNKFIDSLDRYEDTAMAISQLGPFFDSNESWSGEQLNQRILISINDIIDKRSQRRLDVVQRVIFNHIKPYFSNQHKSVNADTGRVRMRDLANEHIDSIDAPAWKTHKFGIWGTLALLMSITDVSQCWFMFLPPTMSMLDDPEPFFKVRGVRLARMLIDTLDSKLINQAGLRTLWESSFSTALTFFAQDHGAELLIGAVEATLALYRKTTVDTESLYKLTLDSVIQPWFYAGDKLAVLFPTFTVLPQLLEAMDINSVRFLKAIIPQINKTLLIASPNEHSLPVQTAALDALSTLIRVCEPRIHQRRVQILEGLVKAFVKDGHHPEHCSRLQYCFGVLKKTAPQVLIFSIPSSNSDKFITALAMTSFERLNSQTT
ncbi:hypothetical protein E3P98_03447 [Wallemia ichthyophaga]|nr:hypothetical protein E3P98_03447 [Wallemia ichthyophaga]